MRERAGARAADHEEVDNELVWGTCVLLWYGCRCNCMLSLFVAVVDVVAVAVAVVVAACRRRPAVVVVHLFQLFTTNESGFVTAAA